MSDDLSDEIDIKSIEDLSRTITRCQGNFSFLVGAGTSRAAGIQTSGELIDQWISEEYSALNPEEDKQKWEKEKRKEIPDDQNEYGFWFEQRYTTREERRQFIKELVEDADPTFEHIVLSSLMEERYIPITLTPNFDDLIYDAFYLYHEKRPFLVDHNAIAPQFRITHEDPMIVKLHGDYLYDNLKNTAKETSDLEENVKDVLKTTLNEYGLIVLGYAGKDESIMSVLNSENIDIPDYGLFWCTRNKQNLSESVEKLLKKNNTFLVEIESSKEFFLKLYEELDDLNVPTPVDMKSRAQDRAEQLREGIVEVGGADMRVLASEYMRRDEHENAVNLLTDAIENGTETIELLFERGNALTHSGNFDRSIGDFSEVLDKMEKSSKNYEEITDIGSKSMGRPAKFEVLRARAIARARAGYYEKAIEDFREITSQPTDRHTDHTELAEIEILSGDVEAGIDDANIALEESSSNSQKVHALMQIIIGKILAEEDYEDEFRKFEHLCSEGFRKSWNFTEIDNFIENMSEKEKRYEIKGIKRIYKYSNDPSGIRKYISKEKIES